MQNLNINSPSDITFNLIIVEHNNYYKDHILRGVQIPRFHQCMA